MNETEKADLIAALKATGEAELDGVKVTMDGGLVVIHEADPVVTTIDIFEHVYIHNR